MKHITFVSGEKAIPLIIRHRLKANEIAYIFADLIFHEKITIDIGKADLIREIRNHLWYQGTTVYTDWYEDTEATPVINDIIEATLKRVAELFPELY